MERLFLFQKKNISNDALSNRRKLFSSVSNPRFLCISRKAYPWTLQIGPYKISIWRRVRDMSIERGASRIMLKTSFCQFLAKLLIFTNFLHNIERVLKNDVFGEEMVGIFPATVQIRRIFVQKRQFSAVNFLKKEGAYQNHMGIQGK